MKYSGDIRPYFPIDDEAGFGLIFELKSIKIRTFSTQFLKPAVGVFFRKIIPVISLYQLKPVLPVNRTQTVFLTQSGPKPA
jgi:hypothetical protein